jgi:NADH-quinone oxidoreductase subunit G
MGWTTALTTLQERLQERASGTVKALVSPFWSNEDLSAVIRLVDALGGGEVLYRSPRAEEEVPLAGVAGLARRRDLAPNVRGAELLGCTRVGDDEGRGGLEALTDHEGVVLVLGDTLDEEDEGFAPNAELVVYIGAYGSTALNTADFQLPITTFAEQEGTFTNHAGRVQRFWPALAGPGAARPAWLVIGALSGALEEQEGPSDAGEAFQVVTEMVEAYRGLTYDAIGSQGASSEVPVPVAGD